MTRPRTIPSVARSARFEGDENKALSQVLKAGEMAQDELDLRGLKCPLPALLAKRALVRAKVGEILIAFTDDPMAPVDVPHMCHREGYEVLAIEQNGAGARMILRRPA